MTRKTHPTPEAVYQEERDRVRRDRDAAFAKIMDEARREFQQEVENSRIRGKGGRPRKERPPEPAPVQDVESSEHALDEHLDQAAFAETVHKDVPPAGSRTGGEDGRTARAPQKVASKKPAAKKAAKPQAKSAKPAKPAKSAKPAKKAAKTPARAPRRAAAHATERGAKRPRTKRSR
jgi:hypothetical protein